MQWSDAIKRRSEPVRTPGSRCARVPRGDPQQEKRGTPGPFLRDVPRPGKAHAETRTTPTVIPRRALSARNATPTTLSRREDSRSHPCAQPAQACSSCHNPHDPETADHAEGVLGVPRRDRPHEGGVPPVQLSARCATRRRSSTSVSAQRQAVEAPDAGVLRKVPRQGHEREAGPRTPRDDMAEHGEK